MMEDKTGLLFQASVLESLKHAVTRGTTTIADLLAKGDTGFGTIEFPSGEMVIIDGIAYVGNCSGEVFRVADEVTTPFAFTTKFTPSFQIQLGRCEDMKAMEAELDREISECSGSLNCFYMVKIHAVFPSMNVRTTTRVRTETGTESLREYTDYEKIEGTVIALRCPVYAAHMNQPGWHMHFISDDRRVCGHLMECSVNVAQADVAKLCRWEIELPQHDEFANIQF